MKKIIVFVLVCAGLSGNIRSQEPEIWIRYEKPEYGFIINFPAEPQTIPQSIETELGELLMNMFQVDMSGFEDANNLVYMVNFTLFPDFVANRSIVDLEGFYSGSIGGMVGEGELLEQSVCEISGLEGRQVKISLDNGAAYLHSRMVLSGSRFYMIMVFTGADKENNGDIVRFLDSFVLI